MTWIWRWVALAMLYVCASPIYAILWIRRTMGTVRRFQAVRDGIIACPHCGSTNALDVLATCRRCGTTEFGSRLRCSNCHQTSRAFACDVCTATIRVL